MCAIRWTILFAVLRPVTGFFHSSARNHYGFLLNAVTIYGTTLGKGVQRSIREEVMKAFPRATWIDQLSGLPFTPT